MESCGDHSGTYYGSLIHVRNGDPVCDPCREARNRHTREYRRNNPEHYENTKMMERASRRAKTRLSRMYSEVYTRILDEEMKKEIQPER